jgi:hypothetical protein
MQLGVCQERPPLSPENSQPVQGNIAAQSEATRPAQLGWTAAAHLSARKVASAAAQDQAGDAARDKDEQQWGSAKRGDAGLEEDGERFSQYNTLLYGRTADNCCTSPSRGILMPSDQLYDNDGISHLAKLEGRTGLQ